MISPFSLLFHNNFNFSFGMSKIQVEKEIQLPEVDRQTISGLTVAPAAYSCQETQTYAFGFIAKGNKDTFFF